MNYAQKNRNSAVKNLLQGNEVFANFSSDCDGCYTQSSVKVVSVQHLIDLEKGFYENSLELADGFMYMTYVFNQSEANEYYWYCSWLINE